SRGAAMSQGMLGRMTGSRGSSSRFSEPGESSAKRRLWDGDHLAHTEVRAAFIDVRVRRDDVRRCQPELRGDAPAVVPGFHRVGRTIAVVGSLGGFAVCLGWGT